MHTCTVWTWNMAISASTITFYNRDHNFDSKWLRGRESIHRSSQLKRLEILVCIQRVTGVVRHTAIDVIRHRVTKIGLGNGSSRRMIVAILIFISKGFDSKMSCDWLHLFYFCTLFVLCQPHTSNLDSCVLPRSKYCTKPAYL